ncbi:hypothetical protein [Nonomuraea indica]|uniref:hypothetical protein n=1 Tax=Nonomuraea indica TaxID=1581193 RepID=UPI000C79AC0F|nr:hypothetical protein [Nonomuraea indica]
MGRHTGGADDANERGNGRSDDSPEGDLGIDADRAAQWAAVPDPSAKSSFWDRVDEPRADAPGWPELPDRVEVTGQWAPMPQRDPGEAIRRSQSDPFETTGAFAPPPRADGGSVPPADQPFETTGAFARPPEWDAPAPGEAPDSTQTFGPPVFDAPRQADPFGGGSGPFAAAGRPAAPEPSDTHVFGPSTSAQGSGALGDAGPQGGGVFGDASQQGGGAFGDASQRDGGAFGDGGARSAFGDTRPQGAGPAGDATQAFGAPGDRQDPSDGGERTQALQAPGGPPEPGDVKVYGSPTMVDATAPEWSERDNGFLGSGWSSDGPAEEEPAGRRRGRRKPPPGGDDLDRTDVSGGGRRGRLALLSVAAVVVVLGGTVAGVKLMSGSGGAEQCQGATCAAVQGTSQPGPTAASPVDEAEEPVEEEAAEEDTEEPTENAKPSDTPTPRATATAPAPRRTSSPEPKPTRTKKEQVRPSDEPSPPTFEETSPSETPTDEVTTIIDPGGKPTDGTTAAPLPTGTVTPPQGGGQTVNVDFDVVRQRVTGYTARVAVVNASAQPLRSPTLSLPVEGRVLGVKGAEWSQDGDLLIIDVTGSLEAGGSAAITFTATGKGAQPPNCGLIGGECAVS